MVIWNLIAIAVNTVSIFIVYYECAFHMRTVMFSGAFVTLIELILAVEVIIIFFKAFPERESPRGYMCILLGYCGLCKNRFMRNAIEREKQKK